jgi:hypothetical protein
MAVRLYGLIVRLLFKTIGARPPPGWGRLRVSMQLFPLNDRLLL